jgi:hypothetical protein
MDTRLLAEAKRDIPLYFNDFKNFWALTTKAIEDKDLIDCYAATLIFKNWLIAVNHVNIRNLDDILKELHEDINASFFRAYFGNYRSAHMHLRSVIELALQLIYFYQHEVEYSQWREADFRIKHEELTSYLKKHPNLKSSKVTNLLDDITKSWKLYSKHIHAEAPKYFQTSLQSAQTKKISKADLGIWKNNFLKTAYQINKLLLIFFKSKLNSFPTINRDLLLRNMKKSDLPLLDIKTS